MERNKGFFRGSGESMPWKITSWDSRRKVITFAWVMVQLSVF